MTNNGFNICMGLDVSTSCIGISIVIDDNTYNGKLVEMTHIKLKKDKNANDIENLFLKKKQFISFIEKFKNYAVDKVFIEEPLLSSNNKNTVATLLRFNGMISDAIYTIFGVVPDYISSYDSRLYCFPELMAVRKFDKAGKPYENKKIIKSIKDSKIVLFGSYPWTIDKKQVVQEKINEIYPSINWIYDKKGELKKENFDGADSLVSCIGMIHKLHYGEFIPKIENIVINEKTVEYDVYYWDKKEHRKTYLNVN